MSEPNAVRLTYGYDAAGRQTSIQDKNSAGSNIAYSTYGYDAADRLTSTKLNGGATITFTYDSVNELINDGTNAYTYDLAGNRTMAGYTTGTDNQVTGAGAWAYTYDNAGNLSTKSQGPLFNTTHYGYDGQNRLTSIQDNASGGGLLSAVTYVYDVEGNRIEEDDWTSGGGSSVSKFAYDGADAFSDFSSTNTLRRLTKRRHRADGDSDIDYRRRRKRQRQCWRLRIGHGHADVDQLWGRKRRRWRELEWRRRAWSDPAQFNLDVDSHWGQQWQRWLWQSGAGPATRLTSPPSSLRDSSGRRAIARAGEIVRLWG